MKNICVALLLVVLSFQGFAQDVYNSSGRANGYRHKKVEGYDPDKLVLGGGLNLGYSSEYSNFGISPKVGYRFNDVVTLGVGVGYQYYKFAIDRDQNTGNLIYVNEHILFPAIWAKLVVYKQFYLAADLEYNFINISTFESYTDTLYGLSYRKVKLNKGLLAPLVGAGYRQEIGGRTTATFEVMYDLIQDSQFSPYYKQLVYRAGIFVGF